MKLLLDTHLLMWLAEESVRLSATAISLIGSEQNTLFFSTVSIWETAIKFAQGRPGFGMDPGLLRTGLLANDYHELPVLGEHAVAVAYLPQIHKDPFDRLLIAQSRVEGILLLTADANIARYGGLIQKV